MRNLTESTKLDKEERGGAKDKIDTAYTDFPVGLKMDDPRSNSNRSNIHRRIVSCPASSP